MDIFEFFKETETLAEKVQRVFEESRARIQAADLTDAQKENLILKAGDKCLLAKTAAEIIESVKAADGLVYDCNSKAKMIGGDVVRRGSNFAYVSRDFEFTRVSISDNKYSRYNDKDYISISVNGNYRQEINIPVMLRTEDGKKSRLDGIETAAEIEKRVAVEIAEIEKIASFAEVFQDLEAKKREIERLAGEIKGATAGLYEIQEDFGFELNSWSIYKSRRV